MKIKFTLFILLLTAGAVFAQDDLESIVKSEQARYSRMQSLSKIQYPGDSTIDAVYYKLELTLPATPHYLYGATTVTLKSSRAGLNSFFLDLNSKLKTDSVFFEGQKLSSYTHQNSKLSITLPKSFNTGEQFSVKVYYQGVPDPSGFGSYADTSHNGSRIVWTLSEPYGAMDWFVCKDTPGDKADSSEVWVTCQKDMKVASNGTLVSDTDNGNNTHTVKWKNHYPIAQYLISIAATNYTVYTNYFKYTASDSMPVTHYVFPEDFNDFTKGQMDQTINMLKVYSDKFGLYPFIKEKYGHAQFMWGGGMEHQTITSLVNFSETLVSHELGHQWFGDKITCARWEDIWLNEGFAEYCSAVYNENAHGKDSYNSTIVNEMNRAKNAQGSIYVRNISSVGEIFNGNRSYAKGAVVLHMLRGVVGDSVFFNIMKTYINDPKLAYSSAATADFQAAAEKVYGQSLQYFFDEWIYGQGYPKYTYSWNAKTTAQDQISEVSLTLNQSVNSSPAFFTMPVRLKITTSLGDTTVTVMNNQQNQLFSIIVKGSVIAVTVDPDNLILKSITTTGIGGETSAFDFRLDQNYPNPFNPSTKISFHVGQNKTGINQAQSRVTIKVFDALGRQAAVLLDEVRPAGDYEIEFNAEKYGLMSGIYYYQMNSGSFTETRKMTVLK